MASGMMDVFIVSPRVLGGSLKANQTAERQP